MRAIARLVYSYFTSTPLTRALSVGGLVLCAASLLVLTSLPQSEHMLAVAYAGLLAFFLGSAFMPLMVGKLSRGHAARLLPHGRVKLLVSMMLTVALVALPAGLLTPFAYVAGVSGKWSDLQRNPQLLDFTINLGWVIFTSCCILAGWLYLAMYFITSQRNVAGFAKGLLVVVIIIVVPTREVNDLSATTSSNLLKLAVAWLVFGGLYLVWPRLKGAMANWRIPGLPFFGASSRTSGREVDLILGTANPWVYIAAQVVPVFIATFTGLASAAIWLYFLAIMSAVTGAVSGQAAERSRALWLRSGWSRAELFAQVEKSFWRHNSFMLGVLLLLMVGMGSYSGFPTSLLAAGLPLLILGTVLSTYLGLMITRGLGWTESLLGIAIMLALMAVPLLLQAQNPNLVLVAAIEFKLLLLSLVLRIWARRRWTHIDWTQCRPSRVASARNA